MTTKKDAYYFSHDSNARNDDKILELRSIYGYEGYGLFWAIIEVLRDSTNYKFELKKIKLLQISLAYPVKKLQSFIETCINLKLFCKDDEFFWSERLLKSMNEYNEYKLKLSKAGTLGNEIKKQKATGSVTGGDSEAVALNKIKEIKEIKESKGNKYSDDFLDFLISFVPEDNYDIDKCYDIWLHRVSIMDISLIKKNLSQYIPYKKKNGYKHNVYNYLDKRVWLEPIDKSNGNGKPLTYYLHKGIEYIVNTDDYSIEINGISYTVERNKCYVK